MAALLVAQPLLAQERNSAVRPFRVAIPRRMIDRILSQIRTQGWAQARELEPGDSLRGLTVWCRSRASSPTPSSLSITSTSPARGRSRRWHHPARPRQYTARSPAPAIRHIAGCRGDGKFGLRRTAGAGASFCRSRLRPAMALFCSAVPRPRGRPTAGLQRSPLTLGSRRSVRRNPDPAGTPDRRSSSEFDLDSPLGRKGFEGMGGGPPGVLECIGPAIESLAST